jgi:hypothetical protein
MKTYDLVFNNGDRGQLREFEGEGWACLICGELWSGRPPYLPNDGVMGPKRDRSSPATGDICECCDAEYGLEEAVAPSAPPGSALRQLVALRTRWLDRSGWDAASLAQLERGLGITEERARRDAAEIRRAGL